MLRLTRIARFFGGTHQNRRAVPARKIGSTRLSLDQLETRESPASLSFGSTAGIYGGAALDGAVSGAIRSLRSSNFGNIAVKTSNVGFPQSNAYASLNNYSGASSYKAVELTTSAYTTNFNRTSEAVARTTNTTSNGGLSYVGVQILPTTGEQYGQRVQVTLKVSFSSTIGRDNNGYASNRYSFYANGQKYLDGVDTTKGTETFSRTVTITTTIGATVNVAVQAHSYAGPAGGGAYSNVATVHATLAMSVQRI